MATPYDDTFKIFISENAQDFASWLVKGAQVREKLATEFQGRKLEADALFSIYVPEKDEEVLLQIECQSGKDPDMPGRLLGYHHRARNEHKRSVSSFVIYLRDDGEVEHSPLRWTTLGKQVMEFEFTVIEVAKMMPDEFRQLGLPGLLPFMVLTQGGATREVAEEVFTGLEQAEKRDSLAAAYTLASLAFGKEKVFDQHWLLRRVSEMDDVLRETPVYQEMTRWAREEGLEKGLEKGREEGLQKGRQEGRQEGRYEGLRQALLAIVTERFPKLLRLTKKQLAVIEEPEILQLLIVKMSIAQSAEEAQTYLLEIGDDE